MYTLLQQQAQYYITKELSLLSIAHCSTAHCTYIHFPQEYACFPWCIGKSWRPLPCWSCSRSSVNYYFSHHRKLDVIISEVTCSGNESNISECALEISENPSSTDLSLVYITCGEEWSLATKLTTIHMHVVTIYFLQILYATLRMVSTCTILSNIVWH